MVVIFNPPNFRPINGSQFQQTSRYFDRDQNGSLSQSEMTNAASALRYFGSIFGNDNLNNIGNAFDRMALEARQGNRALDSNGDGQVNIASELGTAIRRNNPNQFETADLRSSFPPPPGTNFNPVNRFYTNLLFQYADGNVDGKVTFDEMKQAKGVLDQYSGYRNYSNVLQRFMEEIDNGNPSVDANGDRAISYRTAQPFPTGLVAPAELDSIISRNDPFNLETRDLRNQFPPTPVGLRAF